MWSVGTILNGLLSFMYEHNITTGSISTSKAEKRRLAAISLEQNLRSPTFRKLFPEWAQEYAQREKAAQVHSATCTSAEQLVFTDADWPQGFAADCIKLLTSLVPIVQERERLQQTQPAKQAQPATPSTNAQPRTLNSTLITLGVVAGVFGLLLVPLMTK